MRGEDFTTNPTNHRPIDRDLYIISLTYLLTGLMKTLRNRTNSEIKFLKCSFLYPSRCLVLEDFSTIAIVSRKSVIYSEW